MMKRYIIAAVALIGFVTQTWADTDKLLEADGWTKITTLPTTTDIANNYYVFVDNSYDLMLGVAKGVNQSTKWYSLGVYYQSSVDPTAADMNGKTWILETQGDGYAMRNLEYSVLCFQTEWNANYRWDTNDVQTPNEWTKINLAYLPDGYWTIENGHDVGNYIGPWTGGNFANGAECAGNKTASGEVGRFQIYAISRTQFKQNLLDNASSSNPVDLTPWYVDNATFDAGNRTGWTEEGSGGNNNTSFGGGCEIWNRSNFKIYQNLTVPNGKYKVSLQMAGTTGAGQVYGSSGPLTKTVASSAAAKDNYQNTILAMIEDRAYGKVLTDEIEVSNGSLEIGMSANASGGKWLVFDNFKLYCTGVDLSAYQSQLSDLVTACNTFIGSNVVPDACETAISNAITQYNQTYSNAKEYSNAIVALTAVLNTYRNDTELQTAYASFNAFKTNVTGLTTGQSQSSELTTFNTAVNNATTAVEAATTPAAITAQIPNLRSAALTYISGVEGQFNITFLASQNYADWKRHDGGSAGIVQDQFLANRPNDIPSFAENFEWTAETTGNVLYQTVSELPKGYYQVGMYTMALSTSQRDDIQTEATEGDANRTFAFAGDLDDASSIQRTGMPIKFATAVNFDDLTTLDVNVHLSNAGNLTFGVQKDFNGSNWHFAQIVSIVYSNAPDLTALKATRDALVSEAEGLLAGADAALLTDAQQQALQDAINNGEAADDFDALNTVTLTTLPNAINIAKQQIQQVKDNRVLMIAALERFENDYNLVDGTDYRRLTMSAGVWETLIDKVNDVTTALDDVSLGYDYAARKNALIAQMDATDASLRLFKSYKAMVEGTTAVVASSVVSDIVADNNMDTDAAEQAAIAALNTAFDTYALNQTASFSISAFLGENLDFSAEAGSVINSDNSNTIRNVTGWEVDYADADTWAVIQTDQSNNAGKLYMRKNWGNSSTTLTVAKQKMLPIGKYQLSLKWDSNMENMTNLSCYKLGNTSTSIGENTSEVEDKTLTYDFEVTEPTPFDLVIGFQKKNTGNTAAQLVVDDVTLQYIPTIIELADNGDAANGNVTVINNNADKRGVVTLSGRTLWKDDSWNTLCLPFSMTAEQLSAQLAPTALMELDVENKYAIDNGQWIIDNVNGTNQTGLDGTVLYLFFKDATTIEAGKPYLIKWASGDNLTNPVFRGVTVSAADPAGVAPDDGSVTFRGTYAPAALTKDDHSNLYLGADNKLCWPGVDGFYVNAFRAYFQLSEQVDPSRIVLNLGDETTGISDASRLMNNERVNKEVYDLQGRRVDNARLKHSAPGCLLPSVSKKEIYIQGGKKLLVK